MKIANWNIEWMNHWFTPDSEVAKWRDSEEITGVSDISDLARRVAGVITSIDPDVLAIQEGPSRLAEMTLFVEDYLSGDYEIVGPSGKGQQKLYVLIKKSGAVVNFQHTHNSGEFDFSQSWLVDIDGKILDDALALESYEFTREPLLVTLNDGHRETLLINIHLKSKYIHNGQTMWRNPATQPAFVIDAVKVRRRISAEAMRIREYLNDILSADNSKPVIVCGDFNDGPGTDFFERFYLTHNLVAAISGNPFNPKVMLRHCFADKVAKDDNYTAVFDDFIDNIQSRKILLDHILASPGLYWNITDAGIAHAEYNSAVDTSKSGSREKYPSDHRPQWIIFYVLICIDEIANNDISLVMFQLDYK